MPPRGRLGVAREFIQWIGSARESPRDSMPGDCHPDCNPCVAREGSHDVFARGWRTIHPGLARGMPRVARRGRRAPDAFERIRTRSERRERCERNEDAFSGARRGARVRRRPDPARGGWRSARRRLRPRRAIGAATASCPRARSRAGRRGAGEALEALGPERWAAVAGLRPGREDGRAGAGHRSRSPRAAPRLEWTAALTQRVRREVGPHLAGPGRIDRQVEVRIDQERDVQPPVDDQLRCLPRRVSAASQRARSRKPRTGAPGSRCWMQTSDPSAPPPPARPGGSPRAASSR